MHYCRRCCSDLRKLPAARRSCSLQLLRGVQLLYESQHVNNNWRQVQSSLVSNRSINQKQDLRPRIVMLAKAL